MYKVEFYRDKKGRCPTIEFLDKVQIKIRAKVVKWISYLEKEGPNLPRPYADVVRGKISVGNHKKDTKTNHSGVGENISKI